MRPLRTSGHPIEPPASVVFVRLDGAAAVVPGRLSLILAGLLRFATVFRVGMTLIGTRIGRRIESQRDFGVGEPGGLKMLKQTRDTRTESSGGSTVVSDEFDGESFTGCLNSDTDCPEFGRLQGET